MAPLLETALGLLGIHQPNGKNGRVKAPQTRLQSADDARRLLQACIQEDNAGRSLERALVKGLVDGNPPYDDARRRAEGRGWECNLNFMEGQAIMNRTAVPYYNLFARVSTFAECRTAHQPEHPDHEKWSSIISRRFHNMLKRWREFNWNIQQVSYWMRLHGIGFAFPDRDDDWRFRALETGSVLVPKGSPSNLCSRIPYVFIRIPYRITELWERIKDEQSAKDKGWNVEAVKRAIMFGMKGQIGSDDWYSQPWETYEQKLKNHDLMASFTDADFVRCTIILNQEFTKPGKHGGNISKFMFTEFPVFSDEEVQKVAEGKTQNGQFLFSDPNCYDEYLEALLPFFRNTGDGTWHSVRGYAMEAFKHLEVDNRLLCQAVNRAFIDSSVVLNSKNSQNRERLQLAVWGTVVKLPAQTELQQTVVQGGLEGPVLIHRLLSNHLSNNLGVFAPRNLSREDGRGEQPTARHVDYQAANEASIGEGEITIWYEQLDSLYQTMFVRAADASTSDEEAKRFQRECEEDGVPPDALRDMEFVRANRQNGYGSPEMGIMKMRQMLDIVPMLPEDGKQNFFEDYVTQAAGPEKTTRYAPRIHIPGPDDWQASVENQMIAGGRLPIIQGQQDDVIHLQLHFEDAEKTLGPVAQSLGQASGMIVPDPRPLETALNYAQIMGQHAEEHISRLLKDPSRAKAAKYFETQFKQLAEFSKELWTALRRARRQQQIEQQEAEQATSLSALDQAKVDSVRTSTALAAEKTRSTIENQRAKTVQGMAMKEAKTAQELSINRRKSRQSVPSDVGA